MRIMSHVVEGQDSNLINNSSNTEVIESITVIKKSMPTMSAIGEDGWMGKDKTWLRGLSKKFVTHFSSCFFALNQIDDMNINLISHANDLPRLIFAEIYFAEKSESV